AVYLLGARRADPAAPSVEGMPAREGLMTLVGNAFASRLIDRALRGREFEVLGRLAVEVPLRRVRAHSDPAHLSRLCDAILDDCRSVLAAGPLGLAAAVAGQGA